MKLSTVERESVARVLCVVAAEGERHASDTRFGAWLPALAGQLREYMGEPAQTAPSPAANEARTGPLEALAPAERASLCRIIEAVEREAAALAPYRNPEAGEYCWTQGMWLMSASDLREQIALTEPVPAPEWGDAGEPAMSEPVEIPAAYGASLWPRLDLLRDMLHASCNDERNTADRVANDARELWGVTSILVQVPEDDGDCMVRMPFGDAGAAIVLRELRDRDDDSAVVVRLADALADATTPEDRANALADLVEYAALLDQLDAIAA